MIPRDTPLAREREPERASPPPSSVPAPSRRKHGRSQRQKGDRGERGFVKLIEGHGLGVQRVPSSGAAGGIYGGDVKVWTVWTEWLFEGKCRKNGFKQLYDWLSPENIDALFLKADRKPYLVVMTADKFAELVKEAERDT